jgi:hypothetical protein
VQRAGARLVHEVELPPRHGHQLAAAALAGTLTAHACFLYD